ncbi:hypothetical protein LTS17_000446 [Exophiala oligosperma]
MDDPAGDSSPSSEPSSPSSYEPPPPSSSQQPILLPSTIQPRLPTVEEEEDSPVTERHPPLSAQPLPPLSERSPPPSNEQPSPPTSDEPTNSPMVPPNHLNLRVVYLVTGNPRPPHNIGILHVDTTVSALRERIQESLPEHPSPQHQRLIYHGRPLLRSDATLREVFRIQAGSTPGPLPFTLHIVIQSQQDATTTATAPNATGPLNQPPGPPTNPSVPGLNHELQAHFARVQQQVESDLHTVQHGLAMLRNNFATHVDGPVQVVRLNQGGNPQNQPGPFVGLTPQQVAQLQPPAFRGHQAGPNPRTVTTNTTTNIRDTVEVHRAVRPNRHQTTVMSHPSNRTTTPSSQDPPAVPPQSHTAHQPPQLNPTHANTPALTAGPLPLHNLHPPYPPLFDQHQRLTSTTRNLPPRGTAWLLWTATGPRGFLFSPGFGYFTSMRPVSQTPVINAQTTQPERTVEPGGPTQQQPLGQADGAGANVDRAIVRPGQRLAQPQVAQGLQNAEDNDIFAFLIQRGWLFLRLYLFMFVFSEPGTWKRWAMIIIAVVVCLQPQNGPFVRGMQAARRHLDNLIGPQAPQPQLDGAAQGQGANATIQGAPRPANIRGAVQMTPEEAAARLLRERRGRNRGIWRESLYRIEQGVALFLASLIPGVGERHVMAREEARRQAQREEEERRRAEEEAAAGRQTSTENEQSGVAVAETNLGTHAEVKVDRPEESSPSSSSVQIRDAGVEDGQLRNRTT